MTLGRFVHQHLIVLSLFAIACEWKPPRRPIQTHQDAASTDTVADDSVKVEVHTANTQSLVDKTQSTSLGQKSNLDQKVNPSPKLSKRLDQQNDHPNNDHHLSEPPKNILPNSPASVVTKDSHQSTKNEINLSATQRDQEINQSPKEPLKSKHYLLTIDPEGPPLIHVKELTIAKEVRRREPKEASLVYDAKTKQVTTFLRVRNFERTQKIQLKWIYKDEVIQLDRLQIGISPRWRTWSSLRFNLQEKRYGEWKVEVSTGKGKVLGFTHFIRQSKD